MSSRAELAQALTALRERAGLSVRDLAKEVGSPVATVGGYLSGRHLPTATQAPVFRRILGACGVLDSAEEERWWDAVSRIRRSTGTRPAGDPPPYRGLESFQAKDAGRFFGRELVTAALVEAVTTGSAGPGRMVAVVGPSGSGKSSIVRAGLIPATGMMAAQSVTCGVARFQRSAVITPGEHPMAALATLLTEFTDEPVEQLDPSLRADPTLAARLVAGPDFLLVVDQFEEVFSSCPDELERRSFIAALCAMAGTGEVAEESDTARSRGGTAVVIVLRADFYGTAIREAELVPVFADAQIVVGPMSLPELRRAVTEPARLAGQVVDDDLVELLIRDLTPSGAALGAYDAGALPLMSHALSVTWLRAQRRRMTVADYLATGGIAGAVAQTAEAVMDTMSPAEKRLTRKIFLRLINVDDDAIVTRRRALITDLPSGEDRSSQLTEGEPTGAGSTVEVLDRFMAARLVTADASTVLISHEALLTAWPRLQEWIDEGRAGLRLHRQLADAAAIWQDNDRDPSEVLRGPRLTAVQEWLATGDVRSDLTRAQADLVAASEEAERLDAIAQRLRGRRRKQLVAVVSVLAVLATGLGVFGAVSRQAAATEQETATAFRNLALSGVVLGSANRIRATDSNLADQLSMVAYRVSPTAEARSALLNATAAPMVTRILGPTGPTMQALAPDGTTLAVGNASDGSIRLFSLSNPASPVELGTAVPHTRQVQQFSIAFSPDGRTLAAGSSGGSVELWDVTNPSAPGQLGEPLTEFPSGVFGLVFTPDGGTLIAGGAGGTLARWSLSDPRNPTALSGLPTTELVQTISISNDGRLLAVGGRGSAIAVWDLAGGQGPQHVADIAAATASVVSSAFSPDGKTLAVGARDGAVTIWSVLDPAAPVQVDAAIMPFSNIVNVLTFSADGSTLAAAGSDGSVRLWATASWKELGQFGHPGPVTGLSLEPDGGRLVSSAADGTTRVSSVSGPTIVLPDTVFSLDWKPDSKHLIVAPGPAANQVSTWDVSERDRPVAAAQVATTTRDGERYGGGVAMTSDGRTMAVTLTDGRVQLWDVADPAAPVRLGDALAGPADIVQQVAFSADGTQLAAAANDSSVWLWNVADPSNPVLESSMTDLGGPMYSVAFNPDGTVLAASSTTGTVRLWSLVNPSAPVEASSLAAFDAYAFTVAISPDGRFLAVAGADRTVRRWDITDVSSPREVGAALTGPTNDIYWLDFSPDGRMLAAASTDRSAWLWDVSDPENAIASATLTASGGQLFAAVFSPDGMSLAAGGSDRSVHQWLTDPAAAEALICSTVGAQMTEAEWRIYLPDEPYDPPCS